MSRRERERGQENREGGGGGGGGESERKRAFVGIISFVRVLCLYLCCS